jgi:putative ABC transport system permease protein
MRPNVPLINVTTVFDVAKIPSVPDYVSQPIVLLVVVVIAKLFVDWFFATETGLAMRSTGVNSRMARAQGISTDRQTLLGLAMSNGLIALAGALFAQTQGGADISMGVGTIVAGLAAVIIGETIFHARSFFMITLSCTLGAVLYRFFIALALNSDFIGLQAQDLNLVTAVLVALALMMPRLRRKLRGLFARGKKPVNTVTFRS